MLLAAGAGVDAAAHHGFTALIGASIDGRVEVVRMLLAAGAGVDAAANNGFTALISASIDGRVEVARALLAAGAGVDAADGDSWTALICASYFGRVEVLRALLAAGANKHIITNNGISTAYTLASHNGFTTPPRQWRSARSSTSRPDGGPDAL